MSDRDATETELRARLAARKEKVAGLRASLSEKQRARFEKVVEGRAGAAPAQAAIQRRWPAGPAVLSFAQERLWFLDRLQPESPLYNLPAALQLTGRMDVPVLARSLDEIVRRHEVLRTIFVTVDGEPRQEVCPARPIALPVVDLRELPADQREDEVRRLARAESRRPFDLARGSLLRAVVLHRTEGAWLALVNLHQAIGDRGSIGVLVSELAILYGAFSEGTEPPLPELPIQYADFAIWQRSRLAGKLLAAELAHWRRELDGAPDLLDLPTDRPRPRVRSFHGDRLRFTLPGSLSSALATLAKSEGATRPTAILAGFQALLGRLTGQDDLLVGSAVANRDRPEIAGLIGHFANLLVLRGRRVGEPSCREWLARAKTTALAAYAHQDLPFEKLIEELRPARSHGHHPLVQAVLEVRDAPWETLELPGLSLRPLDLPVTTVRFELELAVTAAGDALLCQLEYATELFDRPTAARLAGYLERLFEEFVEHPDRRLSDLPLLAVAEQHQLRVEWGGAAGVEGEAEPAWKMFATQARSRPEAVALVLADGTGACLTYAELDSRARRLAGRLRRLGVGPEVRVGLFAERSFDLAVAILGIWRVGGAYLPLDPGLPSARLAFLIADALDGGGAVLLAQEALRERLRELFRELPAGSREGVRAIFLDAERAGEEDGETAGGGSSSSSRPGDLAYLIYTSGTTGRPKAVAVEHGSLSHMLVATREVFGFRPGDRMPCLAPFSFDIFLFELLAPLLAGGTAVLFPLRPTLDVRELATALAGITALHAIPALMREVVAAAGSGGGTVQALRLAFVGGDAVPPELLAGMRRVFPAARVVVLYGPTEGTILATRHEVEEAREGAAGVRHPLGCPLPGTELGVFDPGGAPVPIGVAGELYVGGRGVARGYLGRQELTAERFVPRAGGRWYRSGDLTRWRPDGSLEFLGRLDHQVKVRGFRIELGEIESVLAEQPEVRAAAVVACAEPATGGLRLAAYVDFDPLRPVPLAELRDRLRERLPEYMVPAVLVPLPALPRTASGKVDRGALRSAELPAPLASESPAGTATPVEELLAGIWAEVLGEGEGRIGSTNDFFDLGGHSLLATQVVSRVRDLFRVELSVRHLFGAPTLRAFATVIAAAQGEGGAEAVPPLRPLPRDVALPLSFAQERLWFLAVLHPDTAAYNLPAALRVRGRLSVPALAATLAALVRRHEPLRTTFLARAGRPYQLIAPLGAIALPVVDLRGLGAAERDLAVQSLGEREARVPFDLFAGPLLRATLLHLVDGETEEYVLLLTLHHIAGDGWSFGVFVRELGELYAARVEGQWPPGSPLSPLPPLPIQYADFAVWQREWLSGAVLDRQLAWWREQLDGVPDRLDLPLDRPRAVASRRRAGVVLIPLATGLEKDLAALSRRSGVTLFMTFLAGSAALLCRLTGQERLVVGSPVANRTRTETEGLIGMFVNTLALAADLRGDPDFARLLVRAREMALGAYARQDLPFERLVEEMHQERHAGHSPLFQVMLVLQNAPLPSFELPGLTLTSKALAVGSAKFDLTLSFGDGWGGLGGALEYDSDLFDRTTVERWAGYLRTLFAGAVADPGRPLSELSLLGATERAALIAEWNRADLEAWSAGAVPQTAIEAVLAGLWRELLGVQEVGVEDSFLDLGGPSVLLIRLVSRIFTTFHVELHPRQCFASPTIAALAGSIVAREAEPGLSEKIAQSRLRNIVREKDG